MRVSPICLGAIAAASLVSGRICVPSSRSSIPSLAMNTKTETTSKSTTETTIVDSTTTDAATADTTTTIISIATDTTITDTTDTIADATTTVITNSDITDTTTTTNPTTTTTTSTTIAPLPTSFSLSAANSQNSNLNGHQLQVGSSGGLVKFLSPSSSVAVHPFSLQDSTNYLMANDLYIAFDSGFAMIYTATDTYIANYHLKYIICDGFQLSQPLSCHLEGDTSSSQFYAATSGDPDLVLSIGKASGSALGGFSSLDLIVGPP